MLLGSVLIFFKNLAINMVLHGYTVEGGLDYNEFIYEDMESIN